MFSFLKNLRSRRKLFLKAIVVLPRDEWSRIDEWGIFKNEALNDVVREKLEELFDIPKLPLDYTPSTKDLELEIVVPKIQGGELTSFMFSPVEFPVFWRPKIEIVARLSYVTTGKTCKIIKVNEKCTWGDYLRRVFSLNGLLRYKPLFSARDTEYLLYQACEKLLVKLSKV